MTMDSNSVKIPSTSSFTSFNPTTSTAQTESSASAPSFSSFKLPSQLQPQPEPSSSNNNSTDDRRKRSKGKDRERETDCHRKRRRREQDSETRTSGRKRDRDRERERVRRRDDHKSKDKIDRRSSKNDSEDRKDRRSTEERRKGNHGHLDSSSSSTEHRRSYHRTRDPEPEFENSSLSSNHTEIPSRTARPQLESEPPSSSDIYAVDRIGDSLAARYGGPERTCRYQRFGDGRVVGLPTFLRITRQSAKLGDGRKGVEISAGGREPTRYSDSSSISKLRKPAQRRITGSSKKAITSSTDSPAEDFIRIRSEQLKFVDGKIPDYQDIYIEDRKGKRKAHSESNSSESESKSSSDDENSDNKDLNEESGELKSRLKYLDSRVRANPTDLEAWIQLIKIQVEVVGNASDCPFKEEGGRNDYQSKRRREKESKSELLNSSKNKRKEVFKKSVAEVQLSILSRAMMKNQEEVELSLLKLRIVSESGIWENGKIEDEWRNLLGKDDKAKKLGEGVSEKLIKERLETTIKIWQEYLKWKKTDWNDFEVGKIIKVYEEAVKVLRSRGSELTESRISWTSDLSEDLEKALLGFLLEGVNLLKEAGFKERAFGILQSQLEITFGRPEELASRNASDDPESRWNQVLDELESFWDSEALRFGEEGARGWSKQFSNSEDTSPNTKVINPSSISMDISKLFEEPSHENKHPASNWVELERLRSNLRSSTSRLKDPPRWEAGELEVDPFSTILFSDVRNLLIDLRSGKAKNSLIEGVLEYLGLPCGLLQGPFNASNQSLLAYSLSEGVETQFFPSSLGGDAEEEPSWQVLDGEIMEREKKSGVSDPFRCPIKHWTGSTENLLSSKKEGNGKFSLIGEEDLKGANVEKARLVMSQISSLHDSSSLRIARLCLETSQGNKATSKLARSLLSCDGQNLKLWHAFAIAEISFGRYSSARNVLCSILTRCRAFPISEQVHASSLWKTWSELEFDQGRPNSAIKILVQAANSGFQGCQEAGVKTLEEVLKAGSEKDHRDEEIRIDFQKILTAKTYFNEISTQNCQIGLSSIEETFVLESFAYSRMLFHYLTTSNGKGFEEVCEIISEYLNLVKVEGKRGQSSRYERMFTSLITFVWSYISSSIPGRSFRPATIRSILSELVHLFPTNTTFISILGAHESRSKVENHLRLTMDTVFFKSKDLIEVGERNWLYAIYVELNLNGDRFNQYSVRNLFEKAVEKESTNFSSNIWILYVEFELRLVRKVRLSMETTRRSKKDVAALKSHLERVKGLIYRAIRSRPWCKALYLYPFDPILLENNYNNLELLNISTSMGEKDVRSFVSLEDFLQIQEESESESGESEGEVDEKNEMIEKRKLLPY